MTEVRTTSSTGGEKGVKDSQLAWADPLTLIELGKVYGYGATKYAPTNWRKGYEWSKSFSALQRHLLAFWSGEDNDPESGLSHMAHAAWHCLTLMSFAAEHRNFDDRTPRRGPTHQDIIVDELSEDRFPEWTWQPDAARHPGFHNEPYDWAKSPDYITDRDRRNLLP